METEVDKLVKNLQDHYDSLVKKKKKEIDERKKRSLRGPSMNQIRRYEEGRKKLVLERLKEEEENTIRVAKPTCTRSTVCDRLYEQGMMKIMAAKINEKSMENEQEKWKMTAASDDMFSLESVFFVKPAMRYNHFSDSKATRLYSWKSD